MKGILLSLLAISLATTVAGAGEHKSGRAGYESDPGFNGPGSTTAQLAEDDEAKEPAFRFEIFDRFLEPWFTWKGKLNQETGLQIGGAYNTLYQSASEAPVGAQDSGGSGVFRLSGRWSPANSEFNNSGALVFSADNRHLHSGVAPADLGFSVGYLGIPGVLFSDIQTVLGDFNWQQPLNNGRSGLVAGRYDPNDFFDVLGYANPWTSFQNAAILFNLSIALADWSTGIGAGHWFNDQWYALGAINDVNGVATTTNFFDDSGELYSTAEIGWSPSRTQRYLANVHLMFWHADERIEAGVEESEGFTIGANWTFGETWMTFLKAGWSDGSAPLYKRSITAGFIYHLASRSDLLGLGINWGSPSSGGTKDQVTTELFYRFQVAQNFAITPSVQLLKDPALNPTEDEIWISSIRARFSF